jgi:hypothetical protein
LNSGLGVGPGTVSQSRKAQDHEDP